METAFKGTAQSLKKKKKKKKKKMKKEKKRKGFSSCDRFYTKRERPSSSETCPQYHFLQNAKTHSNLKRLKIWNSDKTEYLHDCVSTGVYPSPSGLLLQLIIMQRMQTLALTAAKKMPTLRFGPPPAGLTLIITQICILYLRKKKKERKNTHKNWKNLRTGKLVSNIYCILTICKRT